jgi:WD40 repeat protein
VICIAFSPNGTLLASGGFFDNAVKLWEVETGRELRALSGHSSGGVAITGVTALAFSPDSQLLAAGSADGSVSVWDVQTGNEIHFISGASGSLGSIAGTSRIEFSPNGRMLASQQASSIQMWDVASGQQMHSLTMETSGFAFTSDGQQLALLTKAAGKLQVVFRDTSTEREGRAVNLSGEALLSRTFARTPEGHLLAAAVEKDKNKVKIWDVTSGGEPRVLTAQISHVASSSFSGTLSPDGRFAALAMETGVRVWDLASQQELRTLNVSGSHSELRGDRGLMPMPMDFSFDGRLLASGDADGRVRVWETSTGREKVALVGHANPSLFVAFDADGKHLLSGKTDWNLASGAAHRIFPNSKPSLGYLSPNSILLAEPSVNDSAIQVWDVTTQRLLKTLSAQSESIPYRIAFSPDSRLLAATYTLSAAQKQKEVRRPTASNQLLDAMKAMTKGMGATDRGAKNIEMTDLIRQSASNDITRQVRIWDLASGLQIQTLAADTEGFPRVGSIESISFSPDGRYLASGTSSGQIKLWDVSTWREADNIAISSKNTAGGAAWFLDSLNSTIIKGISFSPNGQLLAVGSKEFSSNFASVVSSAMTSQAQQPTKTKRHKWGGSLPGIGGVRTSVPPSTTIPPGPSDMVNAITYTASGPIKIFDLRTRQQVSSIPGHANGTEAMTFSGDGKFLASSGDDSNIKLWEVASGKEIRTLTGNTSTVVALAFSPDGSLLASAAIDGTTRLWDAENGEDLATLVSLNDGNDWLVVTHDGLFDGSPAAWNTILWRFAGNTFDVAPIEVFFNEYYYPGLLADLTAGRRPHAATKVEAKDRRQPKLKIELVDPADNFSGVSSRNVKLRVTVTSAPAGAQDVRLFRNGSLVKIWRGDVPAEKPSVSLETVIPITAGLNKLYAYAFNHDNVKSTDTTLDIVGAESLRRKGDAYVLTIGINEYANTDYNLRYAVDDAHAFGEVLRQQEERLNQFEHINVIPIYDGEATKAHVLKAISDLTDKAQPEDAVFIFIAGHGTANQNHFYMIPHDLGYSGDRTKLDGDAIKSILAHSISDRELEKAFEPLDASRVLLVLDACNSGQALEAEEKRRGPMNSKGLAQLAYEKGMYILTAAQSYQAAQETSQLGHGLLTYTLVEEGLREGAADFEPKDGQIMAREWLSYAGDRVPELQLEKIQQARILGRSPSFTEGSRTQVSQQPRLFYRRELEDSTWVVARP